MTENYQDGAKHRVKKTVIGGMPALVAGEGEPILFLHGFMSSKEAFFRQIDFFSKRFKAVAVDLKGFGENLPMLYPYTLDDYARDVRSVIAELGGKVIIVAHSFGCRIAFKLAAEQEKIQKLVLCGAAGLKPKRSVKYYCKSCVYRLIGGFFSLGRREKLFFSPDYNMLDGVMKQSFKYVTGETFDGRLKDIKIPVLAIFGSNDDQTPPNVGARIKKGVRGAELLIMKGCGHFCFVENSAEFNYVVNEFL